MSNLTVQSFREHTVNTSQSKWSAMCH